MHTHAAGRRETTTTLLEGHAGEILFNLLPFFAEHASHRATLQWLQAIQFVSVRGPSHFFRHAFGVISVVVVATRLDSVLDGAVGLTLALALAAQHCLVRAFNHIHRILWFHLCWEQVPHGVAYGITARVSSVVESEWLKTPHVHLAFDVGVFFVFWCNNHFLRRPHLCALLRLELGNRHFRVNIQVVLGIQRADI
jgi:hypothetical protein